MSNKPSTSKQATLTEQEYEEFIEFKLRKLEKQFREKKAELDDGQFDSADSWDGDSISSWRSATQDNRGRLPGPKSSITISKKLVIQSRPNEENSTTLESAGVDASKFSIIPKFAFSQFSTPIKSDPDADDAIKRLAKQCASIRVGDDANRREQIKPSVLIGHRRQVAAPDLNEQNVSRRSYVNSERDGWKPNERDKSRDSSTSSSRSSVRRNTKAYEQPKNSCAPTSRFDAVGARKDKSSDGKLTPDNTGSAEQRRDNIQARHKQSKHNPIEADYDHLSTEELKRFVHTLNGLLYNRKREAGSSDESSDEYSIIDGEQAKRQTRSGSATWPGSKHDE
jgi:hypothetical protein